jgi:glycerophosphoryl diester phosphodiesterase
MAAGPRIPAAARTRHEPLVLGHRGASADAPENTLAAFRLAMAQGADGVELDAWRCATGEVVVFHDQDGRRIAGSKLVVPEANFRDLRALDVGSWKGARFAGERIPRLEEALEQLPDAVVNVELKSRGGETELARAAAEVIRASRADERVVVSSFDWRLVAAFRAAAPGIPVGLLFEGNRGWRLRVAAGSRLLKPQALHPARALVTAERVHSWRRRGLAVNVWTVDEPEELVRLAEMGVSAVITNVPGRAVEALARRDGAKPP